MAKFNVYHPYMRPLIGGFGSKTFLSESKIIWSVLKKGVLRELQAVGDRNWVFINCGPPTAKTKRKSISKWTPKLYVCVGPRDYWATVAVLLAFQSELKYSWKFCCNPKLFKRPDKIVIYAEEKRELLKIIKKVRPLLKHKQFHKLAYAATTVQMGFETKGEGLYVGADPEFLNDASWRQYRWTVQKSIIEPAIKKRALDSNTRRALKVMNVSLRHYGPLTFKSSSKNLEFIKKMWDEMTA